MTVLSDFCAALGDFSVVHEYGLQDHLTKFQPKLYLLVLETGILTGNMQNNPVRNPTPVLMSDLIYCSFTVSVLSS